MSELEFLVLFLKVQWLTFANAVQPYAHSLFHVIHPVEPLIATLVIILGLMGRCLSLTMFSAALYMILVSLHEAWFKS
ncbi:hypothetical protein HZ992_12260 [Rhizobacter sp. AJA081-3]|uniref:hypothetical protein n=1 Tax=Rhizobacter sp. AJA081-3 TaxID=2753607 RepID=UPI001ADFDBC6|nr:hypothetical protein [Rhizobacter sp. AJA081-3]QTN25672.1 hypothetical protein HZ992_12260 [Rhizobacter sp. AJA081-3]